MCVRGAEFPKVHTLKGHERLSSVQIFENQIDLNAPPRIYLLGRLGRIQPLRYHHGQGQGRAWGMGRLAQLGSNFLLKGEGNYAQDFDSARAGSESSLGCPEKEREGQRESPK